MRAGRPYQSTPPLVSCPTRWSLYCSLALCIDQPPINRETGYSNVLPHPTHLWTEWSLLTWYFEWPFGTWSFLLFSTKKWRVCSKKNYFLYWGETQNSLRNSHSSDVTIFWCYMYTVCCERWPLVVLGWLFSGFMPVLLFARWSMLTWLVGVPFGHITAFSLPLLLSCSTRLLGQHSRFYGATTFSAPYYLSL